VICGENRDFVAAVAWVNQAEARGVCGGEGDVPLDHPRLREHLGQALASLNAAAGSAGRVQRLLLLTEPPSLDAGEITDKGYINQRACLERRAAEVDRLYASETDPEVIVAGG
jgi:feruloyl-CoA synthase